MNYFDLQEFKSYEQMKQELGQDNISMEEVKKVG